MPEHSCYSSCWSQGCHSYSGSQREHQDCPSYQSRWCQLGLDCWCLSYFQDRAIVIVVDHQLVSQQGHSGFDWQPRSNSSYFEHQIVESCFEQRLPNYWYCLEHLQAPGYWTHRAPVLYSVNYWQLNMGWSLVTTAAKPYPSLAIMVDFANLKIAAKDSWELVANLELRRCCCWCCQYMHCLYQICSDQYNLILACCSIFHVGHLSILALHHLWHFSFYCAWLVLSQSISGQGCAFVVEPAKASFACKQRAIWVCHLDQLWSV